RERERREVSRGAAVPDRGIAESGDQHAGGEKRRDELVHAALYTMEYNEANAAVDGGRNAAGPRRSPPRPWLPWRGTRRAAARRRCDIPRSPAGLGARSANQ